MDKFVQKNLSLISFVFIPIFFLWHPNWMSILGSQPYWPLFWLLPWSMIHGSKNGVLVGLFLGLTLDSISLSSSFTQIPGLILCGFLFGKISISSDFLIGHFRYGLICCFGSLLCSLIYIFQILMQNLPEYEAFLFYPSFKNIFAQVFLTGIFAPIMCSRLFNLFINFKSK